MKLKIEVNTLNMILASKFEIFCAKIINKETRAKKCNKNVYKRVVAIFPKAIITRHINLAVPKLCSSEISVHKSVYLAY